MKSLTLVLLSALTGAAALPAQDETGVPKAVPKATPVPEEVEEVRKAEVIDEAGPDAGKPVPAEPAPDEEPRVVKAVPNDPAPPPLPPPAPPKPEPPKIPLSLHTDPNARPVALRIPAPRGLIVDRHGKPLAQNRVANYLGIEVPLSDGLSDNQVLAATAAAASFCRSQFPGGWTFTDADILDHYQKRRWVPLLSAAMLPADAAAKMEKNRPAGVVLRPFFVRTYPESSTACHLIGYMQKTGSFSSRELVPEELMWPPTAGAGGLEKRFDAELTGDAGRYESLYDSKGTVLSEEWKAPRAGHNVVTTLDLEFQQITEQNLRENNVRGAFVIMAVKTGDVVAAASLPGFDINQWVYGVDEAFLAKLNENKELPQFCRALAGTYPPASTFKIITTLAGLETDKLDPDTFLNCPAAMQFANQWKFNASRRHEGELNAVGALKRSVNTWMFQSAKIAGGAGMTAMASKFGFGDRTGICLEEIEKPGFMPTPEFYAREKKSSMSGGYLANIAIGQGEVVATPLQVCVMMAAVARGDAVPRPRLVKQIQDTAGNIVQHFPPSVRGALTLSKENLAAVRKGMRAVVAEGTGTRAEFDEDIPMAGKTGTGEWTQGKLVVWFAGYVPYGNPEYAYAAVYEGDPGEDEISGGRKVAPIVRDVFAQIYKKKSRRGESPDKKRPKSDEDDPEAEEESDEDPPRIARAPKARPIAEEVRPAQPIAHVPPQRRGGLRWLWGKLRGKPAVKPPQTGPFVAPPRR